MRSPRLRQVARSIPPLFWAVGALHYLQFRHELDRHEREYEARPEPHRNPPPMLRYRVHGSFDEHGYEETGRTLARVIVDCLRGENIALDQREILDFACGPGRVIRDFHALAPTARLSTNLQERSHVVLDRWASLRSAPTYGSNVGWVDPGTCSGRSPTASQALP